MDASQRIDKHIAELGDWRGKLIGELRTTVRAASPGIAEDWKWDTPVWSHNGMVCAAGAFKDHVKLNFFKGAKLSDPKRLFNAGLDAKTSRSIDFAKGDKIDKPALKKLIEQAVALNGAGKKK